MQKAKSYLPSYERGRQSVSVTARPLRSVSGKKKCMHEGEEEEEEEEEEGVVESWPGWCNAMPP